MPRKRFVVALAATALLVIALVLAFALREESGSQLLVPESLPGGYGLVNLVTGGRAVEIVTGIHWSPSRIPVVDAAVAEYGDGTRLWVSRVQGDACRVVELMASKMAEYSRELPYTTPVAHEFDGVKVYLSMDKRVPRLHAFWCTGNLVIWVELGASGIDALYYLIDFYRTG